MDRQAQHFTTGKKSGRRAQNAFRVASRVASQRQRRVAEELRHILAHVLQSGEIRDPALREASITVTEVRISADLRNATVYVMPLGGAHALEIIAALRRSAGFLRRIVTRELALRHTPSLVFTLDETFDQADRISALLARPEVDRDLRSTVPAAKAGDDGS